MKIAILIGLICSTAATAAVATGQQKYAVNNQLAVSGDSRIDREPIGALFRSDEPAKPTKPRVVPYARDKMPEYLKGGVTTVTLVTGDEYEFSTSNWAVVPRDGFLPTDEERLNEIIALDGLKPEAKRNIRMIEKVVDKPVEVPIVITQAAPEPIREKEIVVEQVKEPRGHYVGLLAGYGPNGLKTRLSDDETVEIRASYKPVIGMQYNYDFGFLTVGAAAMNNKSVFLTVGRTF